MPIFGRQTEEVNSVIFVCSFFGDFRPGKFVGLLKGKITRKTCVTPGTAPAELRI